MSTDLDDTIVQLLCENARRSNRDIAQRLGLAESTIAARIRRLEQTKIILGYHARVLKRESALIIWGAIELIDVSRRATVASHLRSRPELTLVDETFGDFDLLFRAECRDRRHWSSIEADLIAELGSIGKIRGGFTIADPNTT